MMKTTARSTVPGPPVTLRTSLNWIIVAVAFGGLLGCGRSHDTVLAEFSGGRITRGEFNEFSAMVAADRALRPPDPHAHEEHGSADDRGAILLRLADLRLAAAEARRLKLTAPSSDTNAEAARRRFILESFMVQVPELYEGSRYHFVDVQHFYRASISEAEAVEWGRRLAALPADRIDAFVSEHTQLAGFDEKAGRQLPLCASCGNPTHEFLVSAALSQPDGRFVRVPGVIAGGVWFVRLISRKTVPEKGLAAYFRPYYDEQARRLAEYRKTHPNAQGRGIPTDPKSIEESLAARIAFDRKQQARRVAWSSFLGLSLGRLAEENKPWPAGEAERSTVLYELWAKDPDFLRAVKGDRARRWQSIREDELLTSILYEREAAPVEARDVEVRKLYEQHFRALGKGPGIERARPGLSADIRHRKQHVIVDRLRERLRKSMQLKLYTDRLE